MLTRLISTESQNQLLLQKGSLNVKNANRALLGN